MTKIEVNINDDDWTMLCQGHAGFASLGNDIVCAAISTLTQTLLNHLLDKDIECDYHIENGYLWIRSKGAESIKVLDVIMTGLRLVEVSYPQYLKIEKGCTTESNNPLQ